MGERTRAVGGWLVGGRRDPPLSHLSSSTESGMIRDMALQRRTGRVIVRCQCQCQCQCCQCDGFRNCGPLVPSSIRNYMYIHTTPSPNSPVRQRHNSSARGVMRPGAVHPWFFRELLSGKTSHQFATRCFRSVQHQRHAPPLPIKPGCCLCIQHTSGSFLAIGSSQRPPALLCMLANGLLKPILLPPWSFTPAWV